MKTIFIFGLTIIFVLGVSSINAQREFTLTTSAANVNQVWSRASIDLPGLTGNPAAIIVATPLGNTETLNPHPICAWYDAGKWNLYNADGKPMPVGANYSIQFFPSSGPNQFLHIITKENLGSEGSYIDNPALNNNPNAQVKILQNHSPQVRVPSQLNHYAAKAGYSSAAGKWYIVNVGGERMLPNGAYNMVIGSGSGANANTNIDTNTSSNSGGQIPTSLPGDPLIIRNIAKPIDLAKQPVPPASPDAHWVLNGTNLVNTNPGNVGIGINTPNAPLGFAPVLGKKITLYPGATGDVGFGVQGNLLQIYSDNPNADVAIGYDQKGTFKERLRVKADGAIEVNGNAGKPGEVLVSKGPGEPPVWSPMSTPVYAFANCGPDSPITILALKCIGQSIKDNGVFEGLRMQLSLQKRSVVVMNGRFQFSNIVSSTNLGLYGIFISANGVRVSPIMRLPATTYTATFSITNLMFRLEPGDYTIDCRIWAVGGNIAVGGEFANLTAYPVD